MDVNRRGLLAGLLLCPICAGAARAAPETHAHPHWLYEGPEGPEEWGKLDPGFQACGAGSEQSPIDLVGAVKSDLAPLRIDWTPQANEVVNNGHTIQANVKDGGGLTLADARFGLSQFHFHTPSEHALDGKRTQMEAHFVHADGKGHLAVVGVLMTPGAAHAGFAQLMAVAPRHEGSGTLTSPVDPNSFLPSDRRRFRYEGSLTTPPCSETVDWNVFATPIEVAQSDIEAFKTIFPMNARPLQRTGRRFVLESS
ncbi:MAG TPA: carbonic anhydrase family protein [Phenylobacterium sp.]|jgi:carbonic anhydrase